MTTTDITCLPRWFAAGPLLDVVARRRIDGGIVGLAQRAGLDRRTVQRLTVRGRLRSDAADHLAIALGCHPCEIWPEWFGPAS